MIVSLASHIVAIMFSLIAMTNFFFRTSSMEFIFSAFVNHVSFSTYPYFVIVHTFFEQFSILLLLGPWVSS
jgi:hypothetical protein